MKKSIPIAGRTQIKNFTWQRLVSNLWWRASVRNDEKIVEMVHFQIFKEPSKDEVHKDTSISTTYEILAINSVGRCRMSQVASESEVQTLERRLEK